MQPKTPSAKADQSPSAAEVAEEVTPEVIVETASAAFAVGSSTTSFENSALPAASRTRALKYPLPDVDPTVTSLMSIEAATPWNVIVLVATIVPA